MLLPLFLFASYALADSCKGFSTFQCAQGTPNIARLGGGTASGQEIGFVLTGTGQFSVFTTNGKAASDVILVAASASKISGTLNAMSFSSFNPFRRKVWSRRSVRVLPAWASAAVPATIFPSVL
jgi:hypothetical protein